MNDEETRVNDAIDEIDRRLQEDDPESALEAAESALEEFGEVPDLLALRGDALWALGEVRAASEDYARAAELLPDAADILAGLARIRFSLSDFAAARRWAEDALRIEERAEAFDVLSRLAEREGRLAEADRLAERASRIDVEAYPRPHRVREEEFLAAVEEAIDLLPDKFRAAIRDKNVAILVEPVPAVEVLVEEEPPFDPSILGLYRGVPLPDRSTGSQQMPDTIHLYRHNIERAAGDRESVVREIAITVYHELGHFFGFDEDELEELDLA